MNNANLTDGDIAESLAELGSVESFVGNIRSQYVTPVLNNILGTQFQNRSNAAQNQVNRSQFNLGGATSESDFETRRGPSHRLQSMTITMPKKNVSII